MIDGGVSPRTGTETLVVPTGQVCVNKKGQKLS